MGQFMEPIQDRQVEKTFNQISQLRSQAATQILANPETKLSSELKDRLVNISTACNKAYSNHS